MRGSEKDTDGTDSCGSKLMAAYHSTGRAQDFLKSGGPTWRNALINHLGAFPATVATSHVGFVV
jgi:hypothetical protein